MSTFYACIFVQDLGAKTTSSNREILETADTIFLAIKPNLAGAVIKEIAPFVRRDQLFISLAAGISLDFIENVRFVCICSKLQVLWHCRSVVLKIRDFTLVLNLFWRKVWSLHICLKHLDFIESYKRESEKNSGVKFVYNFSHFCYNDNIHCFTPGILYEKYLYIDRTCFHFPHFSPVSSLVQRLKKCRSFFLVINSEKCTKKSCNLQFPK